MASINLDSPTGFTSGVVISDEVTAPGGALGSVQTITKVNGVPIAAALEIKSEKGALVLPRMTSEQIIDLESESSAVTEGMIAFNTDTQSNFVYSNGGWSYSGVGSILVSIDRDQILTLFDAATSPLVIPAPGAGRAIIVQNVIANNVFDTTAFADGGDVTIGYGTTPANVIANSAILGFIDPDFIRQAESSVFYTRGPVGDIKTVATIVNQPVSIACATANFTGGGANSNLEFIIFYTIVRV